MRLFKSLAVFAIATALAAPVAAKTWSCTFSGGDGAVPEKVIITHDQNTGAVTVNDPFIQNYVGTPVSGILKSANATRYLFNYSLRSFKDEQGHWVPGVSFSVNIIRATGKASISVNPGGNYESQRGSGTCR
ncbi:MAG: hypothetical protein CSA74_11240 [Rhodobacterales bacterium]|nr:MAG: hypothetical protein CSA74_11240 [Rhodobacterales bacterium]